MLLTNPRIAILHLLLAGLQATWIGALLALLWPGALPPLLAGAVAFVGLAGWMLALELLGRWIAYPLYDTLALVLLGVVTVLVIRLALYPGGPAWGLAWVGRALSKAANWRDGLPPLVVLSALNVLLWQRASSATSRDLNFFSVGVTFRTGLLLLLLFGALLDGLRGITALDLLWLHLGLGLTAVAVSRVSEKASEAQSTGRLLPPQRLLQTVLAVLVAIGATWLFSLAYTQAGIQSFFRLFDPLWQWVRPLLLALLVLVGRVFNPVLLGLEAWLARLLRQSINPEPESAAAPPAVGGENPLESLPAWPLDLARDAFVLLIVVSAALGFVVFLLLYLERVRKAGLRDEAEEEGLERATFGGGLIGSAVQSLRGAGALLRRFGVSRQLLAAISVQNIYANVCRLARRRGRPRQPSQPPDAYLSDLARAFPGHEERLQRITAAYMAVHYGQHPVLPAELETLREDYRALRDVPPPT